MLMCFKCWVTRPGNMGQLAQYCQVALISPDDAETRPRRMLRNPYAETGACSNPPSVIPQSHEFTPTLSPGDSAVPVACCFPKSYHLYRAEKARVRPPPPNHCFSSISVAAKPCGGRQYPNCFPSNNLSQTTAANLKRRFSDRSFGR